MPSDQQQICQRFNAQYVPPDGHEKVGIALGTLANVPLYAVRVQPKNGDCGWYIYGGEHSVDTDFYPPLCAAYLPEYCDKIVPYLGLPPGWRVLLAPDYEDVWFDEELMRSKAKDA